MQGLSRDAIMNLGVYCALAGIVGAKLFMIALDPYFRNNPGQIFTLSTLQSAGIWYGGFILALIFAFLYMRSEHLPFLKTCDLFAPGLALGHGIGRLGCFAAGCCWGKPTQLALGSYLHAIPTPMEPRSEFRCIRTQLYEAAIESLICVFLYQRAKRPA